MPKDNCLMIFTKNPLLGTAKTRIGKVEGDEIALKVYQKLLLYTRDIAFPVKAKKAVYFNQFIEKEGIWDQGFQKRMQVSGDLGAKMGEAFKHELEASSKVIIIGSDCAELTSAEIDQAFDKLDDVDLLIGPANDGGYYLLGMKKYHRELFQNMPWSQENLCEETLSKAEQIGITYFLLPQKSDIDFWEDWEKLGWKLNLKE